MGIDAPRRCFTHDGTKDGKLKRAASRIAACRAVAIENRNGTKSRMHAIRKSRFTTSVT